MRIWKIEERWVYEYCVWLARSRVHWGKWMCKRVVARGGWRLRRWGRGEARLVRARMKRHSGRGEEIKGRGVGATLVTVRSMVSHDNAEGQKLVLQWEVTKEERALVRMKSRGDQVSRIFSRS